jgi:hypothetical protein
MTANDATPEPQCPWEKGALGASEEYAVPRSADEDRAVDESLELQMISIRLPKALIEEMKFLAEREGLGYQPLMRRVLMRFAQGEMKSIAVDQALMARKAGAQAPEPEDVGADGQSRRRRA